MSKVVEVPKPERMKLGVSTSVLFDMAEPDAVWQAEQKGDAPRGSYRRYMMDRIDEPLKIHSENFSIIQGYYESGDYDLVILSRNSALTGLRAIATLERENILPEQLSFTNGAPLAHYADLYGLDMFLTTNSDDAEKADALGIASAIYAHVDQHGDIDVSGIIDGLTKVLPFYTKPTLVTEGQVEDKRKDQAKTEFDRSGKRNEFTFDFDKVLAGPESDDFFASTGFNIQAYRQHEKYRMRVPMETAPWFKAYAKMMGPLRASHRGHIVTARGAGAAIRKFYTLAKWGVEPNGEIHALSGIDKTPFLMELKKRYGPQMFLDDGQKNVDRARKAKITTGLVPSGNPRAYLGSTE